MLADREAALAFAEDVLGGRLFRRLLITIEPTLLTSWGMTEPANRSGAITFHVPVAALERFETAGRTSPFEFAGCHEEVHAVANHLWLGNDFGTLAALGEGVAAYVEELRRGTGLHWAIAGALRAAGGLCDVGLLLGGSLLDEDAALMQLNICYGAATLVEFLIQTYGIEAVAELYGVEWLRIDWRTPDAGFIKADPAEEVQRIFGSSIAKIDAAWRSAIASRWDGSAAEAKRFVQAYATDLRILDEPVSQLEAYWSSYAFRLVGPSDVAFSLYDEVTNAVFELPQLRGNASEEAYARLEASVAELHEMLGAWLDAIRTYEETLELASQDAAGERLAALLSTAEAGYRAAGDLFMADKAAERLAELLSRPGT